MESDSRQQSLAVLQAKNDALRAQVRKLERADHILNIILEGTASATGEAFFRALVSQLALALDAKYVFLGELSTESQEQVRTLAYWREGKLVDNFAYDLLGSPCATVINNKIQYYPQNTYALFPEDQALVQKQIECYLGVPLFNSSGKSIGIIVVMHDQILEKVKNAIPIIGTFAARAAAELERKQSEASLHESEVRYRLLIEQANDAFFLLHKGRLELVNNSFCHLFEVTMTMVYSPTFNLIDLIHPTSIAMIQERLAKKYQATMPSERIEFMAQTINGRSLPVSVSLSYIDYKEGTAVQGILHDLTQQKREASRIREQQELTQALHEIGVAFSSSLELDIILDLLLEHVERVIPYDSANIILIENGLTRLVRASGYEKFGVNIDIQNQPASFKVEETVTWQHMIQSKKPLVISDITQFEGWLEPTFSSQTRSWASAPIIVNGEVVAFISTNKLEVNFYTEDHGNRLAAFAAQAALAWQNALLFTAATERADALNATGNILRALNAASNVQEALPILDNHLRELTGAERITLAQMDANQTSYTFIGFHHNQPIQNPDFHLTIEDTAAAENIINGRSHLVPDITTELGYRAAQMLYQFGIRSYISLPLIGSKGSLGALTLSWSYYHGYNEEQIPFLTQIADAIALSLERSNLYNAAQYRSQELNLLYQVMAAAASGGGQSDILQTSCVEIATFLNIPHVTLSLLDEPLTHRISKEVNASIAAQFILDGEISLLGKQMTYDSSSHLLSELINNRAPLAITVLETYPLSSGMQQLTEIYQLVSALILPIPLRQEIIGIIGIGAKEMRVFQETEIRLLHRVSEELGRVLEITDLYAQLREHAAELEVRVVERTQELADANEQLQALDKMKSRFVSDVSHELRTPVTNLKLYLDLLDHKGAASLDQYLPVLQKQVDRLGQLIQDILNLSRLELGHAKLEFDLLDLNALVTEVVVAHELRAQAKELILRFEPDDALPLILGERNQLAQVVTNLVVNAINYSFEGIIYITTAVSPPNMISLTISDNGIGLLPEDLPHLFDRFYRGQQVRQSSIPGTGLGLAIADEIVRIHDGRLEVESTPGEGSTFRVLLPIS
ncbi:MAG: GAF domain-containing protein [Anaerolineae bacterium]|nr:GAF domain-containing protein [Anaerolineae bacterium]